MTTTTAVEKTAQNGPPLTLMDRCDRCGAQAFFRATIKESDLLFCGHHGAAVYDKLVFDGFHVEDFREKINKSASLSSA